MNLTVILLLAVITAIPSARATTFPVHDVAGLEAALLEAKSNDQDDSILVYGDGTYVINETLRYVMSSSSGEVHNLHILGMEGTAGKPSLDGGGSTQILLVDTASMPSDAAVEIRIEGLTFRNGLANFGGGIQLHGVRSTLQVVNCIFVRNSTNDEGGGVRFHSQGTVLLANSIFVMNSVTHDSASAAGAGIHIYDGTVDVVNNTFAWNEAVYLPDDLLIVVNRNAQCNVYNNIFWSPGSTQADVWLYPREDATLNLFHNDWSSIHLAGSGTINQGNNLEVDPAFTSSYQLSVDSECIDSGSSTAPSMPDVDLAGRTRPNPNTGIADMGVYEYYGSEATATPIPPTPTPSTSPTPTPAVPWYDLIMPDTSIQPGETFLLRILGGNPSVAPPLPIDEYLVLDILGEYWFAPGWAHELDKWTYTLAPGEMFDVDFLTFPWPTGAGTANGSSSTGHSCFRKVPT